MMQYCRGRRSTFHWTDRCCPLGEERPPSLHNFINHSPNECWTLFIQCCGKEAIKVISQQYLSNVISYLWRVSSKFNIFLTSLFPFQITYWRKSIAAPRHQSRKSMSKKPVNETEVDDEIVLKVSDRESILSTAAQAIETEDLQPEVQAVKIFISLIVFNIVIINLLSPTYSLLLSLHMVIFRSKRLLKWIRWFKIWMTLQRWKELFSFFPILMIIIVIVIISIIIIPVLTISIWFIG